VRSFARLSDNVLGARYTHALETDRFAGAVRAEKLNLQIHGKCFSRARTSDSNQRSVKRCKSTDSRSEPTSLPKSDAAFAYTARTENVKRLLDGARAAGNGTSTLRPGRPLPPRPSRCSNNASSFDGALRPGLFRSGPPPNSRPLSLRWFLGRPSATCALRSGGFLGRAALGHTRNLASRPTRLSACPQSYRPFLSGRGPASLARGDAFSPR